MEPIPVTLHSEHGHPAAGADIPIQFTRDWRPAHTVAVAVHDGCPVLLSQCPAHVAATLEWALYRRDHAPASGWRMVDTGHRLRVPDPTQIEGPPPRSE